MDNINDRINTLALMFFEGNNVRFAEKTGTSEANIRNYRKSTSPKFDFLEAICSKLEINCDWLLLGKGDIFTKNKQKTTIGNNIIASDNSKVDAPTNIDNRHYYSESPDVLRAQIDEKDKLIREKDERLREKDERLREKDERLREKDEYISELRQRINELKENK